MSVSSWAALFMLMLVAIDFLVEQNMSAFYAELAAQRQLV